MINNHCEECSFFYEGSSYLGTTTFTITDSLFEGCSSYSGGALYIDSGTSSTNSGLNYIKNSKIKNNEAIKEGGGIYIKDTYYSITDSEFTYNKVYGIVNEDDAILSVRGTGGGIYA